MRQKLLVVATGVLVKTRKPLKRAVLIDCCTQVTGGARLKVRSRAYSLLPIPRS